MSIALVQHSGKWGHRKGCLFFLVDQEHVRWRSGLIRSIARGDLNSQATRVSLSLKPGRFVVADDRSTFLNGVQVAAFGKHALLFGTRPLSYSDDMENKRRPGEDSEDTFSRKDIERM